MMPMPRYRSILILLLQMLALCCSTGASRRITRVDIPAFVLPCSRFSSCPTRIRVSTADDAQDMMAAQTDADKGDEYIPPWSQPQLKPISSKAYSRFRQHVNPLSRRYQMPAWLPDNWPHSNFNNVNLPLYLDIGCGKGGFLLELVGRRHGNKNANGSFEGIRDDDYMNNTKSFVDTTSDWLPPAINYLGLEIRPGVSQYAQARVEKRNLGGILSFVGCNANVDLERLLTLYQDSANDGDEKNNRLAFVSIQFPDPHFKKAHSKRRVVTPALVRTLAKFMKEGDIIFLQSDIIDALEAMREKFVEDDGKIYFDELLGQNAGSQEQYGIDNPLGIPTEREVSVLKKGLPIYRTLFKRNKVIFDS